MNEAIEIKLIDEALDNIKKRTTSLQGETSIASVDRYRSAQRFTLEKEKLFSTLPNVVLHASALTSNHPIAAADSVIGPIIVTRDNQGGAHIFRNSCRHRGARLVKQKKCPKRIVCPYHAWSYDLDGKLTVVPGENECFPQLDKSVNGLIELGCVERYGFIWLCPSLRSGEDPESHLDGYLGGMASHLQWMQGETLTVFATHKQTWNGNWKLFAEGGLETYHFAFAHRDTIASSFYNNIAVIDQIDKHFRVVMPTRALSPKLDVDTVKKSLHDYSHTLFLVVPNAAFLVQKQHVDFIHFYPISENETEITVTTLIPSEVDLDDEKQSAFWQKNHRITVKTLDEDWALGESIQTSIDTKGVPHVQYGKNEWALKAFNDVIEQYLAT